MFNHAYLILCWTCGALTPKILHLDLGRYFSLNLNRFYRVKTSVFWIVSKKPTMLPSKARIIKNKLETAGVDIKRDELPLASVHHAKFWFIYTDPLMRGLRLKTNIIKRKKTASYGNELARINNKEGYVNTHLSQPLRLHLTKPPSD